MNLFRAALFVLIFYEAYLLVDGTPRPSNVDEAGSKLFDFDGDYGKDYKSFIRKMIPGYEQGFIEIVVDLLAASQAKNLLVIGPGRGEELVAMGKMLPKDVRITAYEASPEMAKVCQHQLDVHGLTDQVKIIPHAFSSEDDVSSKSCATYDAINILNVLHFLTAEERGELLRAAASRLAKGGVLVISGNSLPKNYGRQHPLAFIVRQRWTRLGINAQLQEDLLDSNGKTLFSLLPEEIDQDLKGLGFSPLEMVFRALGSAMWYTHKH